MKGIQVDARSVSVVRPRPDEIPWELLCVEPFRGSANDITRLMRIARDGDIVLGGYLLKAPEADSLSWQVLRLAVLAEARGQGLGFWLVGHAVGVAESRGAAEVLVELPEEHPARSLFVRYGFVPVQTDRLCFTTYSE